MSTKTIIYYFLGGNHVSKVSNKNWQEAWGILHVFSKAIKELEVLNTETKTEIKKSADRIKSQETEKAALQIEQQAIDKTVEKLKSVLGIDETKK